MNDLMSFDTAFLTRPLVILTVYGFVHSYFQAGELLRRLSSSLRYDFGSPRLFCLKERALAALMKDPGWAGPP